MAYKIFTTEFDRVVDLRDLALERDGSDAQLKSNTMHLDAIPVETPEIGSGGPLTILLDCSGSMRDGTMRAAAAALRALGDGLEAAGRPFEILGYTTSGWKGGESRKAWAAAGCPRNPGRLCDLMHIVIKDRQETWTEARKDLPNLLMGSILKENVDGEALLWARDRILAAGSEDPGSVLVISDGSPVDDSTLSNNPENYLLEHLREAIGTMDKIPLHAIRILSLACRNSEKDPIWPHRTDLDPGAGFADPGDGLASDILAAAAGAIARMDAAAPSEPEDVAEPSP